MHRFFMDKNEMEGGFARLSGDDAAHMARVLRLGPGDEISVCDGESNEWRARILDIGKKCANVQLLDMRVLDTEPLCRITLYQGIPKAGKLETIIQKCTEVGVCAVVPFECERTVAKPWGESDPKCARYSRVAYEAAKQSGRGAVPRVEAPISFDELVERVSGHGSAVLFWECECERSIRAIGRLTDDVAVIIGPEGGISYDEAQALKEAGAITASLGKRILRTETAGIVAAAVILCEKGDMEP